MSIRRRNSNSSIAVLSPAWVRPSFRRSLLSVTVWRMGIWPVLGKQMQIFRPTIGRGCATCLIWTARTRKRQKPNTAVWWSACREQWKGNTTVPLPRTNWMERRLWTMRWARAAGVQKIWTLQLLRAHPILTRSTMKRRRASHWRLVWISTGR